MPRMRPDRHSDTHPPPLNPRIGPPFRALDPNPGAHNSLLWPESRFRRRSPPGSHLYRTSMWRDTITRRGRTSRWTESHRFLATDRRRPPAPRKSSLSPWWAGCIIATSASRPEARSSSPFHDARTSSSARRIERRLLRSGYPEQLETLKEARTTASRDAGREG